jgi:hypothetical protein
MPGSPGLRVTGIRESGGYAGFSPGVKAPGQERPLGGGAGLGAHGPGAAARPTTVRNGAGRENGSAQRTGQRLRVKHREPGHRTGKRDVELV